MLGEFTTVKLHFAVTPFAHIRQLPLPSRLRDFPADKTVQRIARQDDLATPRIVQDLVQHPRVMVVEKPKTREMLWIVANRV